MPPPLAPWFLAATLAGAAGPAQILLMEPSHDAAMNLLTPANPLLGCAVWIQRAKDPVWLPPTSPLGDGSHVLPLPEKLAELPAWFEAACYGKDGWSYVVQGSVTLDIIWGRKW